MDWAHLTQKRRINVRMPNKRSVFNHCFFKDNRIKIILYPIVCLFSITYFWLSRQYLDALGFTLIHLHGLHPLTILIVSIFLAYQNDIGKWAFVFAFLCGICLMGTEYLTFSLSNMMTFTVINSPELMLILIGAAISLFGELLGLIIKQAIKRT